MWTRDNQSRFLFTSGSCFNPNRNVPIWIMLSCSVGSLRHLFPLAPPGRVGGRKGFCSRAIPGPGPSQNPALCGSPPTKCSSALALYWCEGDIPLARSVLLEYPATSTHSRFGQRGPGRAVPSLSSLPCWVVPPPKTRQSVEPPASSSSSPLRGTASPCLSIPARYSSTPPPW